MKDTKLSVKKWLEKYLIISLLFTLVLTLLVIGLQPRWCVPMYLIICCLLSSYKISDKIKIIYLLSSVPLFLYTGERYKYLIKSIQFNEMNGMIIIWLLIVVFYGIISYKIKDN